MARANSQGLSPTALRAKRARDLAAAGIGKLKELNKIKNVFIPYNTNNENDGLNKKKYNKVARLIMIKDFISEFTWYLLTGFLVISITTNYILEQNCI